MRAARHSAPHEIPVRPGETLDAICGGRVRVLQHEAGYRFNLDPVLLAHFAHSAGNGLRGEVIDLGTGSGIIPLLLAGKFGHPSLTGVEIQPRLAAMAERSVALNGVSSQVRILHGDLREAPAVLGRARFQHVLSNPPYGAVAKGKVSPSTERAIARHELLVRMEELVRAASELLVEGGSVWLVYPAPRLVELWSTLQAYALRPRRVQMVHPRPEAKARLVLAQAVKRGRGTLTVCPPLFLHEGKERFSPAVEAMLAPSH